MWNTCFLTDLLFDGLGPFQYLKILERARDARFPPSFSASFGRGRVCSFWNTCLRLASLRKLKQSEMLLSYAVPVALQFSWQVKGWRATSRPGSRRATHARNPQQHGTRPALMGSSLFQVGSRVRSSLPAMR